MASDRQQLIVNKLNIQPTDRVLEIGCGHGVAASAVCKILTTGNYVGIDRSSKMISSSSKRNQDSVDSGKATFLIQELEKLTLPGQKFNKIFAVRVRLFYTRPKYARQLVEKYLVEGGKITIIYDTPSE
jgi:ubiquinone/menaquinone biosynthesis C-methylase UbiE